MLKLIGVLAHLFWFGALFTALGTSVWLCFALLGGDMLEIRRVITIMVCSVISALIGYGLFSFLGEDPIASTPDCDCDHHSM